MPQTAFSYQNVNFWPFLDVLEEKCIGQGFFKKNFDTLILVNPSAFQIGMPLENWSKIEGAIS